MKYWKRLLHRFAKRFGNRRDEVVYHVGRPGHDGYIDRMLQAWGIDGHNSHTNSVLRELASVTRCGKAPIALHPIMRMHDSFCC